jgi:hypothetical protein
MENRGNFSASPHHPSRAKNCIIAYKVIAHKICSK